MNSKMHRGVTLIELLIAATVSALVLLAVLGIINFSTRQLGAQTSRAEAIISANLAMNAIAKDVGNSINAQTDSNGVLAVYTLPGNTDAAGNYVPVMQNGTLTYVPGLQIDYYLSDSTGKTNYGHTKPGTGTNVWRQYWQTGGLLGLGSSWTSDTAWSLFPNRSQTRYPNIATLTFSNTGLPANTVQITITTNYQQGSQTASYTVSRCVYLSNHN